MNIKPRTYFEILRENLVDLFSLKFFILLTGVCIVRALKSASSPWIFVVVVLDSLLTPWVWLYTFGFALADAFVRAIVWYFQDRNPRYIAKMAERERIEQEKQVQAQEKLAKAKQNDSSPDE